MGLFDTAVNFRYFIFIKLLHIGITPSYFPSRTHDLDTSKNLYDIFCNLSKNQIAKWFQQSGHFPLPLLIPDIISFH